MVDTLDKFIKSNTISLIYKHLKKYNENIVKADEILKQFFQVDNKLVLKVQEFKMILKYLI